MACRSSPMDDTRLHIINRLSFSKPQDLVRITHLPVCFPGNRFASSVDRMGIHFILFGNPSWIEDLGAQEARDNFVH